MPPPKEVTAPPHPQNWFRRRENTIAAVAGVVAALAAIAAIGLGERHASREAQREAASDSLARQHEAVADTVARKTLEAVQQSASAQSAAEAARRRAEEESAALSASQEQNRKVIVSVLDAEVMFRVGKLRDTLDAIGISPTTTSRRWTEGEYRRMNSALRTFVGRREDTNDWVRSQTTWQLMEGIRERDNDASVVPHVEVLSRRPLYEVVHEIAIDRWAGPATRKSRPGVSATDRGGSR